MREQDIITDLNTIAVYAVEREEENWHFFDFLEDLQQDQLDNEVHRLNREAEHLIDCTTCGNCCKNLMINVKPEELAPLAEAIHLPVEVVKEKYIEESMGGQMIMNTIPCNFLVEKKCSIYVHRFTECRDFPHLHKPGFLKRFSGTVMHYGTCPIIYNVIEQLKHETGFDPEHFS